MQPLSKYLCSNAPWSLEGSISANSSHSTFQIVETLEMAAGGKGGGRRREAAEERNPNKGLLNNQRDESEQLFTANTGETRKLQRPKLKRDMRSKRVNSNKVRERVEREQEKKETDSAEGHWRVKSEACARIPALCRPGSNFFYKSTVLASLPRSVD